MRITDEGLAALSVRHFDEFADGVSLPSGEIRFADLTAPRAGLSVSTP